MLSPDEIEDAARRLQEGRADAAADRPAQPGHFPRRRWTMPMPSRPRSSAASSPPGAAARGWKIGLTSRAMQSALSIDIPDSGVLLDDMVFADSATIPPDRFIQPRVEAEIAFVMKALLARPRTLTIFDVLNATDYIAPALEILDTRIRRTDPATGGGPSRTVFDTIADNAANAGIVTGRAAPLRPLDTDSGWIGAIVSRNGVVEETGLGAGVLYHPATGRGLACQPPRPLRLRPSPPARSCSPAPSSARSKPATATPIVADFRAVRHGQRLFRLETERCRRRRTARRTGTRRSTSTQPTERKTRRSTRSSNDHTRKAIDDKVQTPALHVSSVSIVV